MLPSPRNTAQVLSMPPECQLFGTLGCHLCEVAEAVLMPFVEHGLLVELVDICLLYTSPSPRDGA
ncbi:hypothetical protein FA243_27335, partial [Pseudomonas aeruginosa]|nr:hypothetical protein [Pseudomonas aeruginosa]